MWKTYHARGRSTLEMLSRVVWNYKAHLSDVLRKISLVLINMSTQLRMVKNDHVGIFWFQLTLTGSRSFGTHFVLSISSPASVLLVIHIKLSKIVQETAKYALFFMSTWNNKSFTGKFVLYGLFVICVSDRYPFSGLCRSLHTNKGQTTGDRTKRVSTGSAASRRGLSGFPKKKGCLMVDNINFSSLSR